MTAEQKKYPSRIRYEEENPVVSFRISKEDHERLKKISEDLGMSFKEIIMIGAKMAKVDREKIEGEGDERYGPCHLFSLRRGHNL